MAFEKGKPKTGGKKKGVQNKATANAREAIAEFVKGNVDRLNGWLDKIADKDPDKAFSAFMSVIEYHIPKLARTDIGNADGKPFETKDVSKTDAEILAQYMKQKGK